MRRSVQLQDKKEEMRRQNAEDQKHPLVDACAELLKTTVEDNDAAMRTSMPVMRVFDGDRVCPVAVDNYVRRIMKYGSCDPACLAMAMIYLERIKKKWQKTWITSQNVQRLYLVAVMEAAKFHEDCTYTNARWAEIGAISLEEINKLEIAFLSLTEWELFVDRVDYDKFKTAILAWQQAPRRPKVVSPKIIVEEQQKQQLILESYEKKKGSKRCGESKEFEQRGSLLRRLVSASLAS